MSLIQKLFTEVAIPFDDLSHVHIQGEDPILPSPFFIGEAGAAALGAVGYAASELWRLKTGRRQDVAISAYHAALSQRSHAHVKKLDTDTPPLWNPISGLYPTQDQRWIQLHCNFPHHRDGVLSVLGCDAERDQVTDKIQTEWCAALLEETLSDQGLCAAMVRTHAEWQQHPHYQATCALPVLEIIRCDDTYPTPLPKGNRPLSNINVLDLSRVIAGPVAGKTLAEHGARVMRVALPQLPFIEPLVIDTGAGKRSAHIDLHTETSKQQLTTLIQASDVFLQAYRPGGLAQLGFGLEDIHRLNPHCIYVSLSTYSHQGPWAEKHGFDSLVQCVTGIVDTQTQGDMPQHLPAQSLDYLTGYFAALGVMEALRRRATEGGSYHVRVSLVQTAHWLQNLGTVTGFEKCTIPSHEEIADCLLQQDTPFGRIERLRPLLQMSETQAHATLPPVPLGTHPAQW